jgi:hypothetical protein
MSRFFTLKEAQRYVPEVDRFIRDAVFAKSEHAKVSQELKDLATRIMFSGGILVNSGHVSNLKTHRERMTEKLKEAFESLEQIGCLIKDLSIGLVDFPTLYHGEEVYLCWKMGEPAIEFWHGVHEGFPGRKPIDQEFIENHRGTSAA